MKLLQKTNKIYLILSASAFLIGGLILYLVISVYLDSQLTERLNDTKQRIIARIKSSGSLWEDPPFVQIRVIETTEKGSDIVSDTLIYDASEKEILPFRQLKSDLTIGDKTYEFLIRDDLIEKSDILAVITIITGTALVVLLITLLIINRMLSRRIWKPFYSIISDLNRFSQDETEFIINSDTDIVEFQELISELNNITGKAIRDYQLLKRFTEDASHEIQTPLSVIQMKLESFIQDPDLKESQADLIKNALTSVHKLSRLTKSLLLLTKLDSRQFPYTTEVDLSKILASQIDMLRDPAKDKSVFIEERIDPGCLRTVNPYLAESLFLNLVSNAVMHSPDNETVIIELNSIQLMITNKGPAFSGDPLKLFERFYKADRASSSSGLGLSIVKKICDLYDFRINYEISDQIHKITIKL